MECHFVLDRGYRWQEESVSGLAVRYVGRRASAISIANMLEASELPDLSALSPELAGLPGHFAVCISGIGWSLLVADKLSSYPMFYASKDDGLTVSNSARTLARECELREIDRDALAEFRMTGYVTGRDTLNKGLNKLQAGEAILCGTNNVEFRRYYQFHTPSVRTAPEIDLIDELETATNAIFDRLIKDAHGRRIVVPLSGGLDSRVVLCKLKERGAKDLFTFSYGSPGNRDALAAKEIAGRLGVSWEFVPTTRNTARDIFASDLRREYWRFADHLHIVPNLHTFYALATLHRQGRLFGNPVMVNGQSGDFICGNHIPSVPADQISPSGLVRTIAEKHYSHNLGLRKESEWLKFVGNRVERVFGRMPTIANMQEFAKLLELWGWQARQSIRVVHGQRNYDFFGLSWELPLWEVEYLRFFQELPVEHKFGRRLFRRWLEDRDPYGLFRSYMPYASRWPLGKDAIHVAGRAITATMGRKASAKWYAAMDCFSQYDYLYAPFGYVGYWKGIREFSSVIGFMTRAWESENADIVGDPA